MVTRVQNVEAQPTEVGKAPDRGAEIRKTLVLKTMAREEFYFPLIGILLKRFWQTWGIAPKAIRWTASTLMETMSLAIADGLTTKLKGGTRDVING